MFSLSSAARHIALALALCAPAAASAQARSIAEEVVDAHILPRFAALAETSAELRAAASKTCDREDAALRAAYAAAFDAWVAASHLRFGPTEMEDRAFALAFWPDTRGITPRTLRGLIADADPVVEAADEYAEVSIAARGFYALEMMLFDPEIAALGDAQYRCALMQVIAADTAKLAADILADWQGGYADALRNSGAEGSPYRSDAEALQELFKALTYGLEFTSDTRLGRPLGTFDAPHPKRAEAWRAGRSLRHVRLSLASLEDLARRLAGDDEDLQARLTSGFEAAREDAGALQDPVFAGVSEPAARLRVEVLRQKIDRVRETVQSELGPELGVAAGFNALDGD
ncbi:imelysin family protein [Roseovarius nanhaiticus]|uniref:imelysin family protein n=1 Tax=Roseovarius nanhaiticus TaxID=573024 RepID=UPI002491A958|nr:imelysin family protein [Roseovarius nanhaiticus]